MAKHNLPVFPTPFIGRADDITDLSQLLDNPDCHLLTLVGPGGIGKTRLAVEIARCKLDTFPDGAYFVPLQPLQSADQVVSAIIDVLPLQAIGDPQPALLDYLREKRLLLIIDNFEHVLDGVGLVSATLVAAPQVTMLVSSREILNLQGEWVRAVTGLTYPDDGNAPDNNHYSAIDLFTESARRLRADFSLVDEREPVIRICQLVEGMPLGIELAAGWTTALACAEIADEIRRDLDFLATESRNISDRHRSMQAVFDHSWRLLTAEEQSIMRRFAVFRGGCGREAAEQVTGATMKTLAGLVAKSMLRYDSERGRYDVQELLRQYAHERLVADDESDTAHDAHCRYYADFIGQRAPDVKGRRQLESLNEIEADWNNVRAAWGHALAQKNWDAIGQMMETLHLFCDMRARYTDGDTLFQGAVDALEPGDSEQPHPLWGELLVRAASVFDLPESHSPAAMTRVGDMLEIARQQADMGDDPLYLWACAHLIRPVSAEHNNLALLEASLAGFRTHKDCYYMARSLRWLAFTCAYLGADYAERFASYNQQYLDLTRDIGDKTGMAHALYYEGFVALSLDETERNWQEAGAIWRKMGDWKSVAVIIGQLGRLVFGRGDFDKAKPLLEEALEIASEVNYPHARYRALDDIGIIACLEGDYVSGRKILAEIPSDEYLRLGLVVAACGQGDFQLARDYLRSVLHWLTIHPPIEDEVVKVFPMAAILLANEGEPEWAVELLARQDGKHTRPLYFILPIVSLENWALLRQVRDDLEEQLGAAAFDAAWERGESLNVETATRQLLAYLGDESETIHEQANQTLAEPLTPRELEVLALLAQGRSNRDIAEALVIAVNTVKRYVYDICQKLGAANRTHAVARARELRLL